MTDNENPSEFEFDAQCPECQGKKEKNGVTCGFCKGKGNMKYKAAPRESINYLETYTELVMNAIEKITGVKGAWITDLSTIGDFPVEDKELKLLEDELGFPVQYEDKIVDIAKRLKDA